MQDGDMGIRMESGVTTAAEAQAEILAAFANGPAAALATVRGGMTKEDIEHVCTEGWTLEDNEGLHGIGIVAPAAGGASAQSSKSSKSGDVKHSDAKHDSDSKSKSHGGA